MDAKTAIALIGALSTLTTAVGGVVSTQIERTEKVEVARTLAEACLATTGAMR